MSELSRRILLRSIALAAVAGGVDAQDAGHVHELVAADTRATGGAYQPKAFNAHEYATLERLTDLIVPPDGDSPGALAAGAAAWIDMLAAANEQLAVIYTGGLAWLDHAIGRDTGKDFVSASPSEQTALLDRIAYRRNDSPELGPGIRFFDWARRMTVDAFYTSKIGIRALDYRGNSPMAKYEVPEESIRYALKKSGYE